MEIILESGEKMRQPTKEEIIDKLKMILQGKPTREKVADWASEYVMQDEPNISDETVWGILQIVSGIDLKDSPDEYLHVEQDIIDWINKCSN
ncbi:DNA-binding protein [Parageobacillus toebii]